MDTELMIACLDVPGVGVIVCPSGVCMREASPSPARRSKP